MNKQFRKAIMTRKRLLNKLRKFNYPENQLTYKKQRNYCVKLLEIEIITQYRDYKNFNKEHFRRYLLRELSFQNVQPYEFDKFKFIALKLLNSHSPLKEKYIRCNQAIFINKQLCKAIMTRKGLLNKLRKFNCPIN